MLRELLMPHRIFYQTFTEMVQKKKKKLLHKNIVSENCSLWLEAADPVKCKESQRLSGKSVTGKMLGGEAPVTGDICVFFAD